jgi:hypothetical protein
MSRLEDELRELLDQRAEDAALGSAVRMPAEVGARVRRRQALTAVLSGVTLVAIVFLSVLGTRAILKPEMIGQPRGSAGRPFTVFDPPIRVAEGEFRLASGVASGESWNLLAHRGEREQEGISLEVMAPSNGGPVGAGGFTVPGERDLETTTAWVGTNRNDQIIFGAVVEEAANVHLESEDGRTIRGVVISLPESLLPTFDVVVIQVSGRVTGDIVITDEEGQEIVREPYLPAPPPPPIPTFAPTPPIRPDEPIPLFDHFGNAVGFVPWDQAFGEPSGPPGALEEGFPWTSPGLQVPEVTVEEMRATAEISLIRVWSAVRSWWDNRPKPAAPDSAFLRWWASYPIGTEPPEVVEITPRG